MILLMYYPSHHKPIVTSDKDLLAIGMKKVPLSDMIWDYVPSPDIRYTQVPDVRDLHEINSSYLKNKRVFIRIDATLDVLNYLRRHGLEYTLVCPHQKDIALWKKDPAFDQELWDKIYSQTLPSSFTNSVSFLKSPKSGLRDALENVCGFI